MGNRALNRLMEHTEENIRIWDLWRLYGWLLKQNATVVEVKEIRPNEYEVTVSIPKREKKKLGTGIKGVCGHKVIDVTWYDTQRIVLKPSIDYV